MLSGGAERDLVRAEASSLDAVSAALYAEAAEVSSSCNLRRHSHSYSHSRHRIRRPALVFGRAAVVRHFRRRRHKTSPNWRRRSPPHLERFRGSARAVVYSPTVRWLRRRHRLPSRETRQQTLRPVRPCSDAWFSGSVSTWINTPGGQFIFASLVCGRKIELCHAASRRLRLVVVTSKLCYVRAHELYWQRSLS